VTATGSQPTTTSEHADHDDDHDMTAVVPGASTATLAPSPTESFGCEPHGDHWHCDGSITAATTMTSSGFTSVITPTPTTAAGSVSTAGAGRSQVTGLALAGFAAAAVVLVI
jgi:hypothetical protein